MIPRATSSALISQCLQCWLLGVSALCLIDLIEHTVGDRRLSQPCKNKTELLKPTKHCLKHLTFYSLLSLTRFLFALWLSHPPALHPAWNSTYFQTTFNCTKKEIRSFTFQYLRQYFLLLFNDKGQCEMQVIKSKNWWLLSFFKVTIMMKFKPAVSTSAINIVSHQKREIDKSG